ncbi:MAG: hypothetical protein AAFY76_03110 [Cyanobacteria bacterium J06649_11]
MNKGDVLVYRNAANGTEVIHMSSSLSQINSSYVIKEEGFLIGGFLSGPNGQGCFKFDYENQFIYFIGCDDYQDYRNSEGFGDFTCTGQSLYKYDLQKRKVIKVANINTRINPIDRIYQWVFSERENAIFYIFQKKLFSFDLNTFKTKEIFDTSILARSSTKEIMITGGARESIVVRCEGYTIPTEEGMVLHQVIVYSINDERIDLLTLGSFDVQMKYSNMSESGMLFEKHNFEDINKSEIILLSGSSSKTINTAVTNSRFYWVSDSQFIVMNGNKLIRMNNELRVERTYTSEYQLHVIHTNSNKILVEEIDNNRVIVLDHEMSLVRTISSEFVEGLIQMQTIE